jgi:hypothetical protein
MTLGGSDGGDGLLIGPFLQWWDKHTAKREARRTERAERKARTSKAQTISGSERKE